MVVRERLEAIPIGSLRDATGLEGRRADAECLRAGYVRDIHFYTT